MRRIVLLAGLLAAPLGAADPAVRPDARPTPDPRLARQMRWPSEADLERLAAARGKTAGEVLRALGHPKRVRVRADGTEAWVYPWLAACEVWMRGGRCVGTYYTAGY